MQLSSSVDEILRAVGWPVVCLVGVVVVMWKLLNRADAQRELAVTNYQELLRQMREMVSSQLHVLTHGDGNGAPSLAGMKSKLEQITQQQANISLTMQTQYEEVRSEVKELRDRITPIEIAFWTSSKGQQVAMDKHDES